MLQSVRMSENKTDLFILTIRELRPKGLTLCFLIFNAVSKYLVGSRQSEGNFQIFRDGKYKEEKLLKTSFVLAYAVKYFVVICWSVIKVF